MSLLPVPLEVTSISLSGVNLTLVAVVGVIALIALVMAMIFRRECLLRTTAPPICKKSPAASRRVRVHISVVSSAL